jgi:hypothetical protein
VSKGARASCFLEAQKFENRRRIDSGYGCTKKEEIQIEKRYAAIS